MRRRELTRRARRRGGAGALLLTVLMACGSGVPPAASTTPTPGTARPAAAGSASATGTREPGATVPPLARLDPGDGPSLFLGAEEDAPAIGYSAAGLQVEPAAAPRLGRVRVRIEGPMRVRAYAPAEQLFQYVQRRGRVRGAPMYVGPGDHVQVLGPAEEAGRVRVAVRARLGSGWSDSYAGTFPAVGVALTPPGDDAEAPTSGTAYMLPAGATLTLHDRPAGSAVAGVAAQASAVPVEVLRDDGTWRAVRVGHGPYLIGYTADTLTPGEAPAPPAPQPAASSEGGVPQRIAREEGELRRVRAGAKLRFNDTIVAVFKQDGWARVLQTYPSGQLDVFAAADDRVAVRGLVDADSLYPAETDGQDGSAGE